MFRLCNESKNLNKIRCYFYDRDIASQIDLPFAPRDCRFELNPLFSEYIHYCIPYDTEYYSLSWSMIIFPELILFTLAVDLQPKCIYIFICKWKTQKYTYDFQKKKKMQICS